MGTALTRLVENLDLPPREAGEAILAYRAEVLRKAAESIRRWADANEKHLLEGERTGARMAANHINNP